MLIVVKQYTMCRKIKLFSLYLLIIVGCSAPVIGQSNVTSIKQKVFSKRSETTTAVPLNFFSKTSMLASTPTTMNPTAKFKTTTSGELSIKATFDSESNNSFISRLMSLSTVSTITTLTDNHQVVVKQQFITTTAAPPFQAPSVPYRQFDALSFMGGMLAAISITIVGTLVWKLYMARIERSYWSL